MRIIDILCMNIEARVEEKWIFIRNFWEYTVDVGKYGFLEPKIKSLNHKVCNKVWSGICHASELLVDFLLLGNCLLDGVRGVFMEGIWGSNPPPFFWEIFFDLLCLFFKKKIPKPLLNFPVHTKKNRNPSVGKFLDGVEWT